MSQRMSERGMLKIMVFGFYMGAARHEAELQGVFEELKAALEEPMIRFKYNGDVEQVRKAVRSVLGVNWMPEGQWAEAILKAGGKLL